MSMEKEAFETFMKKNPKASKKEIKDAKKKIKEQMVRVESHLSW
jgi:hypothetical protein